MRFADHFSSQAADYARHRPHYPPALFDWLSGLCHERTLALDVACGSGQASIAWCDHFRHVIGSEASFSQLQHAAQRPNLQYVCATAEDLPFSDTGFDLIGAAQAVHWFDHQRFNREADRLLKPGGVLAVWGYGLFSIEPAIDALITHYYETTVGDYWPPERRWIDRGYADLPFPYQRLASPAFHIELEWELAQVLAYLNTWSATQRYLSEYGDNPLLELEQQLAGHWRNPLERKPLRWPIYLLAGRK